MSSFRFLSNEEFDLLERKSRIAYLLRAQQELAECRHVLRDQVQRTLTTDQDAAVPVPAEPPEKNRPRRPR